MKTDSSRRRSAIFGGSFDPVHRGHLAMARAALEVGGLDRVIFMPAAVSPFKKGTVASGEQRRRMIELSLGDEEMDWAEVSSFELNRPAPSYSWETARYFRESDPETSWFWILGTDQWEQIEKWAEPERLKTDLHFLVFSREGQIVAERPGWRHTAIPFAHPASSTAIRGDINAHRDWLTPGVEAFCEKEGIYFREGTL